MAVWPQKRRVAGFTLEALEAYAAANIEPGGGRPTHPFFKWVNIGLGNLKSAIVGTCKSLDDHHAGRYLAAYQWRFNRRFDLAKNLVRLARVALQTAPKPYRSIAAVRTAEMTG